MSGLPILTAAQTREAEERAVASGTSVQTLMERAGAAVAAAVRGRWPGREVLILCGPGNNGGDGYIAARILADAGTPVRVAAIREPRGAEAQAARARWSRPVATPAEAEPAPVLVDALFGTGLRRPLEPELVESLDRLGTEARVAVDLPSGVSTDDGRLLGEVPPFALTVALGALKPAHRLRPAADRCGEVVLADIGLPVSAPGPSRLLSIERPKLRAPGHDDNKYTRGKVVVLGGSMAGAAMLAALSAQRSGAGYVELRADAAEMPPHALIRRPWQPDALKDKRIGAVVCGPGLGHDDRAQEMLGAALASPHPLVLDADALALIGTEGLGRVREREAPAVLTPHEGEFARLFGAIGDDRVAAVRAAASRAGAVVLLKGAATVVARPDGMAAIAPLASPWLATAGTGDVLSGIIGTELAQLHDPFEAAQAAVWLQAEAARGAGPALIADDLPLHLPGAIAACL